MVESGNTVIAAEHNQQIIKASDWITDLGPEGGINGGKVVAAGTPLEMLRSGETDMAVFLRKITFHSI